MIEELWCDVTVNKFIKPWCGTYSKAGPGCCQTYDRYQGYIDHILVIDTHFGDTLQNQIYDRYQSLTDQSYVTDA